MARILESDWIQWNMGSTRMAVAESKVFTQVLQNEGNSSKFPLFFEKETFKLLEILHKQWLQCQDLIEFNGAWVRWRWRSWRGIWHFNIFWSTIVMIVYDLALPVSCVQQLGNSKFQLHKSWTLMIEYGIQELSYKPFKCEFGSEKSSNHRCFWNPRWFKDFSELRILQPQTTKKIYSGRIHSFNPWRCVPHTLSNAIQGVV